MTLLLLLCFPKIVGNCKEFIWIYPGDEACLNIGANPQDEGAIKRLVITYTIFSAY